MLHTATGVYCVGTSNQGEKHPKRPHADDCKHIRGATADSVSHIGSALSLYNTFALQLHGSWDSTNQSEERWTTA